MVDLRGIPFPRVSSSTFLLSLSDVQKPIFFFLLFLFLGHLVVRTRMFSGFVPLYFIANNSRFVLRYNVVTAAQQLATLCHTHIHIYFMRLFVFILCKINEVHSILVKLKIHNKILFFLLIIVHLIIL